MSDIPARVRLGSQTPRVLRVEDIRSLNVLDEEVVVSEDYAAADIPLAAAAAWSSGVNVKGYDRVMLFVHLTVGGASTGDMARFQIDVQAGFVQRSPLDAHWYDRYAPFEIFTGDSTALNGSESLTLDTSTMAPGTEVRFFFDIETGGHYMRFRPSAVGADLTSSRVEIKAIRDLQ